MKPKKYLSLALIGAIMGSMITFMVLPFFSMGSPEQGALAPGNTVINVTEDQTDNIYKAVISKAMPSVVGITTVSTPQNLFSGGAEVKGLGTGFIVDTRGFILTNSHVVDDGAARQVTVLFDDGETTSAEILWTDKTLDLAVIKVERGNLPVAELGDSDKVEVGDLAVAIGNPLGLEFSRTVTEGIISGLDRSIIVENPDGTTARMENLIQTSAAINPGNSGGPLLNKNGQVIGINSAKAGEGEGLGFSIPINVAKPIVDQFIENGSYQKVVMGIQVMEVATYSQLVNIDFGTEDGVIIIQIDPNSVAEKSGLKINDVIKKMNNQKIVTRDDLLRYLFTVNAGDIVDSVVWRDNQEVKVKLQF